VLPPRGGVLVGVTAGAQGHQVPVRGLRRRLLLPACRGDLGRRRGAWGAEQSMQRDLQSLLLP
jgi:hypothetical protein